MSAEQWSKHITYMTLPNLHNPLVNEGQFLLLEGEETEARG